MITAELPLEPHENGLKDVFTTRLPDNILVEEKRFQRIPSDGQSKIAWTLRQCGIRVIEIRLPVGEVGYYYRPASS